MYGSGLAIKCTQDIYSGGCFEIVRKRGKRLAPCQRARPASPTRVELMNGHEHPLRANLHHLLGFSFCLDFH